MKKFGQYLTPEQQRKKEEVNLDELFEEVVTPKEEVTEVGYVPIDPQTEIEFIKEVVGTIQGEKGERGEPGLQGPKGDRGEKGERGEQGLKGDVGPRGERGERGEKGDVGPPGEKGEKGDLGPTGPKGLDGRDGINGKDGKNGLDGKNGKDGKDGINGKDGVDGKDGKDGRDGIDGKNGVEGKNGERGPKGDKGDRGERGEKGEKGDRGDVGPQGEKGERGERGEQGPPGPAADIKPIQERFTKLTEDINKRVTKITSDFGALAGGGGSGSYWLNDLGDTDHNSIINALDQQVLTFDATLNKWIAADSQGGGGGPAIDSYARSTANSGASYANSAFVTANAASYYANVPSYIANSASVYANAAFLKANTPQTQLVNGSDTLSLNGSNKVELPGGTAYIFASADNITLSSDNTGSNYLEIINNVGVTLSTDRAFEIRTNADGTDRVWNFTQGGSLFFPDSTFQTTAFTGTAIDSTARNTANAAFLQANTPSHVANSAASYANAAFVTANAASYFANLPSAIANSGASYANAAFITANAASYFANLPSAIANSGASYANAAFTRANNSINANTGGTITAQLNINYTPPTTTGVTLNLTGANTKGGTSYADLLQLTNSSAGVTNPNKYIRISQSGALEIINSGYTARSLELTDAGDLNISGNVTGGGVKTGYSAARPGFRVYGSGSTSWPTNVNTGGYFNSNQYTVDYNQGSYLNTTSGVFTAPVAGLYIIQFVGRNAGNTSISQLAVVKNATGGNGSGGTVAAMLEFGGSSTMNHAGAGTILQLNAGDTIVLKVLAGTIQFDSNDNWSVAYIG